jgi:hypothetical protein
MKIISVKQPYAWLIVAGHKNIENRTWTTRYRGPLLIHASLKLHDNPPELPDALRDEIAPHLNRGGGIIGRVDLVDIVTSSRSKWFNGPFGFVLTNSRELPFVQWKGQLGIRDAPETLLELLDLDQARCRSGALQAPPLIGSSASNSFPNLGDLRPSAPSRSVLGFRVCHRLTRWRRELPRHRPPAWPPSWLADNRDIAATGPPSARP